MNDLAIRLNDLDRLAGLLPDCTTPRAVAEIARAAVEIRPEGETLTVTLAVEIDDSKLGEHLAWLTERAAHGQAGVLTPGKAAVAADTEPPQAEDAGRGEAEPVLAAPPAATTADNFQASPWSEAETQQLMLARASGWTFAQIAKQLGRTAGACRLRFNKLRDAAAAAGAAPDSDEPGGQAEPQEAKVTPPVEDEAVALAPAPSASASSAAPAAAEPPAEPEPAPAVDPAKVLTPASAPPKAASGVEAILQAMADLDDSFEPVDDVTLVEQRYIGAGFPGIAEALGCDEDTAKARWRAILKCRVQNKGGILTQKGWADLRAAVARRAADAVGG